MHADREGVRIQWSVAAWVIGIVFGAGVVFSTVNERSYIDGRFNQLQTQQAKMNTKINLLLIKGGIDPKSLDPSSEKGE